MPVAWRGLVLFLLASPALLQEAGVDPKQLESLLAAESARGTNLFVAFFDPEDLRGANKRFVDNFAEVSRKLQKLRIKFVVCQGELPPSLVRRFYLHYYTLPKIKLFRPEGHLTYYGGTSPKHIEAWVRKTLQRD